jgi:adenine-specific DNA-methyltransferase
MMETVFIGGSRDVHVLDEEVRRRIDRIVEKRLPVVIGDANGADKAVQDYLNRRGYRRVEVFCLGDRCRNNIGRWPFRAVASRQRRKDFRYYATKDRLMAREADTGFMIWDGHSVGTLANVGRLARRGKKILVYMVTSKRPIRLANEADWERFLSNCPVAVRTRVEEELRAEEGEPASQSEASLF